MHVPANKGSSSFSKSRSTTSCSASLSSSYDNAGIRCNEHTKAIQNVLINPLDARSASLMLCTCMIESSANLSVIAGCIMQLRSCPVILSSTILSLMSTGARETHRYKLPSVRQVPTDLCACIVGLNGVVGRRREDGCGLKCWMHN